MRRLDYFQLKIGIEAAEIIGVARDHALAMRASAHDDTRVDHINFSNTF